MRKADLINIISDKTGIPKVDVLVTLETMFKEVKESLAKGENIYVRGFGSFKIKEYEGYAGRNPKTGESVTVSSKRLPFFRAGKELKEFINQ